jgi:hypothetical protein
LNDIRIRDRHLFPWERTGEREPMLLLLPRIKVLFEPFVMFILDGRPDLNRIKAFIAKGNMGIVYEANQWHSPMCALDEVGTLPMGEIIGCLY